MNALPIRYVVCPMDLPLLSANTLDWANSTARARNAALRMLHVVATKEIVGTEGLSFGERNNLMETLRSALQGIDPANRHGGAAIRQGDPGQQILQFVRLLPADLVVMGAAGAERPERPTGSTITTVVARSPCPVLIVPSGRRVNANSPGLFQHIVCAVDVTPVSVGVMRQALSLAWETHARLLHVCVMTKAHPSRSEIEDHLRNAIPPEASTWCDIDVVVKAGVPAAEIVKVAESTDVDLLVIGPPRRWSSTTEAVLAKSLCPVLVTHDVRPLPYPGRVSAAAHQ